MLLLAYALLAFTRVEPAFANPVGGVITGGSATISTTSPTTVHIAQHSDRAVIDWRGFDIAPTETTEFAQPSNSSIALNRVNSTSASQIDGKLTANGNVVIINQNGVVFGSGAQVDANSLVVSTADTDNSTFMAGGKLVLNKASSNPDAAIVNNGTITAKQAGLVGLVAPDVENQGVITARLGRAQLASGDTATVDLYGDGLLEVAVSDRVTKQLVKNTGTISADGGVVALTAAAGANIISGSIQVGGTLQAQTVSNQQGAIIIASATTPTQKINNLPGVGNVVVTAKLDVSGKHTGQKGGSIQVLGKNIALMSGSMLDASGVLGGGEILVGGDYHGGTYRGNLATPISASAWGNTAGGYSAINGTATGDFLASLFTNGQVPTASRVFVDSGVNLLADATGSGNGGRIIVWSDNGTVFNGFANVGAYGASGNGGFIETSGEAFLQLAGSVNASATNGATGTWLLDPADLTVSNSADNLITAASPFQSTGGATSNLSVSTLVNALNGAANVIISSAAGSGGLGNITFADAVSWSSVRSLTVNASNNIVVNNTITNAGTGDINLNANVATTGSIAINSAISTGGAVNLLANQDVTVGAGLSGNSLNLKAANGVTSGTGNLSLTGNLTLGSGSITLVSGVNGTRPSWTADATSLSHAGSFGGSIDIEGFNTLTINRPLALTTDNNILLANNTLTKLNNNLSTLGTGTITVNGSVTLPEAAAVSITTGNGAVNFGGAVSGTAGGVAETLSVNSGTGTTAFSGALNGFDPTVTAGTITFGSTLGATTTMGAVVLNAVNALTLPDITATSVAITTTGATGDIAVNGNITSAGGVTITSFRDLTLAAAKTITAGGAGALSLEAANGVTTGTGNLTLNGNLNIGTGALTLYSGINGTRPSWTATTTSLAHTGSFTGPIDIEGFNNLTLSRAIAMVANSNLTFANNTTLILGANLSTLGTGTITISNPTTIAAGTAVTVSTVNQPITFGSTVTGGSATSSLTTTSGTATTTFTGNLNNFILNATADTITFGGTLGATTTMGAVTLSSAQALTLPDITAASLSAITTGSTGDISVNGNITSAGAVVMTAFRDLTEATGKTIQTGGTGALTLKAANGVVTGTGNLTISGILNQNGTGGVTLYSGINGTRPSLTLTTGNLVHTGSFGGPIDIEGFGTLNLNRALAMTTGNNLLLTNNTATILNANLSTLGTGTITVNGPVTLPEAAAVSITTGNGAASFSGAISGTVGGVAETLSVNSGTGTTTFSGALNGFDPTITAGTISFGSTLGATTTMGAVVLTAANALTLPDITANSIAVTTTGTTADITVNGNLTSASNVVMTAFRDLTLTVGKTIVSGSTGNLTLKAANGVTTGTGNLNLNGNLNIGTGNLTLYSGINGTRPSWTPTTTNLVHAGSFAGNIDIEGFNVLTLTRAFDLAANNNLTLANNTSTMLGVNLDTLGTGTITVSNPLTIIDGSTVSITTANQPIILGAISGVVGGGTETLTTNSGTGNTTFGGALNGFVLNATANGFTFGSTLGATTTMGAVVLNAVNALTLPDITATSVAITTTGATGDIAVNGNITSAGGVTITSFRDLTLAAAKTITAGGAGALSLEAANGVTTGTGNLTLNGNLNIGTGALTLYSGINGTRPSWTATTTSLAHTGSFTGPIDIEGFNNLTLSRAIAMVANSNLTFANNTTLILGANLSTLGTGTITISNPTTIAAGTAVTVSTVNQPITFGSTVTGGSATSSLTTTSGTATTTFTGNLNNFILNATADTITFGGTLGATTTMGAVTLSSAQALTLPDITAASLSAITTGSTGDISVNGNITSAGAVVMTAFRDLTEATGKTIQTGGTGALTLKAANGVVTGTGNLTINGILNQNGTGGVTLYSGINGTRPSLTLTTGNLVHTGSFGGPIDIEGFGDLTINRPFVLTAGNILFANNTRTLINSSNLTTAGTGTITISNPLVLQEAAAPTFSTANAAIVLGGTVDGTAGGATETLTTNSGTAATTYTGAMNGISLTGTAGTFTISNAMGATTPMVAVSLTSSAGALALPDITLSGNLTVLASNAASGNITVNGNIASSAGNVSIISARDLTEAASKTIASGPTNSLLLEAANGVVTGTGNLTLNGNISGGTGALTLISGVNGTRPAWTANTTTLVQQGASFGAITMTGFGTVTLNRDITSSGNINIVAYTDLTQNAANTITNGAVSTLTLEAGGGLIAGVGNLNLNGTVNAGSGTIILISGINGTRPNYTLNTTNFMSQSTFGAIAISGFQDVTINRNLTSGNNISIIAQRDLTLNSGMTVTPGATSALTLQAAAAVLTGTGNLYLNGIVAPGTGQTTLWSGINGTRPSWTVTTANFIPQSTLGILDVRGFLDTTISRNLTSSGNITIIAYRDLTITAADTLATGAAGALNLQAAAGSTGSVGNLNINGNISVGTGALNLVSGINGTRPSFTATTTNFILQGATVGAVTINGFQDFTINRNITSNSNVSIISIRDLTLGATYTITPGSASTLVLEAANGSTSATGNLTLNGILAPGSNSVTLSSGINTTRPSYTITTTNWVPQTTTVGGINITGFQDITISRNIIDNSSIIINAMRDLTLSATYTITTGAVNGLSLQAANGLVAGTGNLNILGNISTGTTTLTLISGINGTRPNYIMSASNFTQQGTTINTVNIQGFQDFTLDTNLNSNSNVTIITQRDLTINTGRTLTTAATGFLTLEAANNNINGTGDLYINGNLAVGTGAFTLHSGINGTRSSYSPNATTLVMLGATFGTIDWQGFATLDINRPIISSGTINFGNAANILENDVTSTGAITFPNATSIAEGKTIHITSTNANITFSNTFDGAAGGAPENVIINAGTGAVLFTSAVGSIAPLGNVSITADNLTLSSTLAGTGALTLAPYTAGRAINTGTATTDGDTTAGFNLTSAENGRIVDGWSSVTIGSLTSGAFINNYANYTDPVNFLSGNDFTNAVAVNSTAPIFIQAVRDVIVNQNLVTSDTTANALTLVAGRNFLNNKGAGSLTTGTGGRWLAYSSNPTDTTGEETLSNNFNRYSCTYGSSCPALDTGNGLLYSYTPLLTITISGQTYNYGDAVIVPTGYTLQTSGYINTLDSTNDILSGTGNFQTSYVQGQNAGTGYTITNNGSTFISSTGYGFTYIANTSGIVSTRAITVSAADQAKVYGFGSLGTTGFNVTNGSLYSTDTIGGVTLATNALISGSGQYNVSTPGTPWTITVSGATFSSGLGSNYAITYAGAPGGLSVTQKALSIGATGINRVYDGLTDASVTLGDNRISGDVLTLGYTSAGFTDKNVGTGKAVNVSGITLTGTDAGNYSFNTTASTTANITQKALSIGATGINRVYDGLTDASVTLGDNRISGDVLTLGYTSAGFTDKNVGTGKAVNVSGITLTGTDAGNYSFNTTASTTANITQKALSIGATGINRVYDGLTDASVTLGDNRISGDVLTLGYTSAGFTDKNVGTGKAVNVSGITLTGTDAGNYSFNTTASTTANITQKALSIGATGINRVYDGLTDASVTLGDNRISGDVLTLGYTSAGFTDKNVGTGKAVNVSGITLTGTDAGNYSFNTTASTTANITQKALSIGATGINRVYDGLTDASVTLGDNRISGDVLTLGYTSAGFTDKNVGTGKAVNVSGITLTGTDAGNYSFNTTASTTANITQKALSIGATGINRVYDGLTDASVTLGDNRISGDVLTLGYTSAGFTDKNVGTGKAVNVSGITLTGTDAGNYSFNTTASTTANITQKALSIGATGINRVYDGLTDASVTLGDNRISGDVLTLGYASAGFTDKNVGTGKAVNVSGITLTGTDAGNYSFNTTASTTANITQKALSIGATGINRVYDGLTDASVTLGDNRISGDVLTLGYTSAGFTDKNVGTGKAVNVSGITLTGTDAGNYSFNTTASTTANITQKALSIGATGINRVYDGLTDASVTLGDNRISGDVLTLGYTSAGFTDKNVGTGKAVNVSGITLTGTDAGNYSFNTTASTTANITQKALSIGATGINRVYDGLTDASVTLGDNRISGDVLTLGYTSAGFTDKNVGTGKAVNVSGITLTGTDAGNYSFNTTASTTANITQKALSIGATGINRVYDGLTDASVTLGDNRISGDVLTLGYTSAGFTDKNVGTGKAVNVSGITLTGTDAGNYSFNTTASTTANITQKALSIGATGINRVYDGLTDASVTLGDNRISGDVLTLGYTSAGFTDKNVGTGKAVNVSGITLTGTDAGNYSFNTTASTTANITQKALSIGATGINRVYDGLTDASVTLGDNRISGDVLTLGYASAGFTDKNVGTGKAVNVSGITLTGTDAGNYSFNTTASTTANITQKALSIGATGINRVYDGLTDASVTLGDNRISGDVLTLGYTSAGFTDKNVGTGKAVNVSGITLTGTDAGNYSFNTTASTTANITQKALSIGATGINRVYDGLTDASVTLGDNRISGDVLTLGYTSAGFTDKNVGTGKAVNVSGITLTGTDAGNYSFNTTASTTANITQKALSIGATGINRVYDGLTDASVTLGDNRISGDVLTLGYTSAGFTDKNVGTGKAVNVSGITLTGTDAGNYSFNTTASTTANITQKALSIGATGINRVYDGLTDASVTLGDNRISGDVLTLGYTSAGFTDKNVGTGKAVNVSGITLTGTDAGNYSFNTTASTTANITQKALSIGATGINRVYDGLTDASVTLGDNRISGDVLTLGYTSAGFTDKNVGTGKAVNVSGITLTGTDAGNYSFNTTASTTANITQKALSIGATGINRVYDGLTDASVTLGDNRISGDVLTLGYASAGFTDKNVGTGKAVNVSGITLTGTDAGNYSFNTTASTTANITQKALSIGATGINRVYDGLTDASVTLGDNRISGDVLTLGYTSAGFTDKNVGTGKAVNVSGITLTGTDAGNYSFNTTASTTANITQKALSIGATGINRVYDGLTDASVTLGDNRISGDVLTLGYTSAGFTDKNVGTGKAVNVSGITLTGTDAGNYSFNTTASTTANITQKALSIGATGINRVYDGLTDASVTLGDNRISGDVLTLGYASAGFTDKNVGTGKAVNVSGITLTGTDAGNYSFNTTASTTANITQKALSIGATGINRVYDGLTDASVTLGDNRISGDVLTLGYASAGFTDAAIGSNKPITVSGINVTGSDSGNYSFNTNAIAFANILDPAALPPPPVITPISSIVPSTVQQVSQNPITLITDSRQYSLNYVDEDSDTLQTTRSFYLPLSESWPEDRPEDNIPPLLYEGAEAI